MAEKIKFEKALERLEKIVDDLESGEVALETALEKYEEGVKLARICQGQLAQAEKKIELLSRQADGSFETENFEINESDSDSSEKKNKVRRKKAIESEEDEDFLL